MECSVSLENVALVRSPSPWIGSACKQFLEVWIADRANLFQPIEMIHNWFERVHIGISGYRAGGDVMAID
jgi:hypothetical protein